LLVALFVLRFLTDGPDGQFAQEWAAKREVARRNTTMVLAGTVVGEDGVPLRGVEVFVTEMYAAVGGQAATSVVEDMRPLKAAVVDGTFRIRADHCDRLTVVFGRAGHADEAIRYSPLPPGGGGYSGPSNAGTRPSTFVHAVPPYVKEDVRIVLRRRTEAPVTAWSGPLHFRPGGRGPNTAAFFARPISDVVTFRSLVDQHQTNRDRLGEILLTQRNWGDEADRLGLSLSDAYGGFVSVPPPLAGQAWPAMPAAPPDQASYDVDVRGNNGRGPYWGELRLNDTTLAAAGADGIREGRFYVKLGHKYGRGAILLSPPDADGGVRATLRIDVQDDGTRALPDPAETRVAPQPATRPS
jgi:hypothetical protein